MTGRRSERGQVIAVTLAFLVVLVVSAAAVLDVGSWYVEDRKLQATVDAAALAGVQALPHDQATADDLAREYADKNGGGLDEVEFETSVAANDTIEAIGSRPAPGFFARILGIDSVTVHATAKARIGILANAWGASPIAVDHRHPLLSCRPAPCSEAETELDLDKVGPGAFKLVNVDGSHGGTGPAIVADWILNGYEGYMPLDWYFSDSGAKFNSSQIKDALTARIGDELLFPVYDDTRGSGSNFEYRVIGWVGFVLTGYDISGSKTNKIFGNFTSVIWDGIYSESSSADDLGAYAIALIE